MKFSLRTSTVALSLIAANVIPTYLRIHRFSLQH